MLLNYSVQDIININMARVFTLDMNTNNIQDKDILYNIEYQLKNDNLFSLLKRGDLIENIFESGYRTKGVYLVDNISNEKQIVKLCYEDDDYGAIPYTFKTIKDFRPDHFIRANFKNAYWHTNYAGVDPYGLFFKNINQNSISCKKDDYTCIFEFKKEDQKTKFLYDIKYANQIDNVFEITSKLKYSKGLVLDNIRLPYESIIEENQEDTIFYFDSI